MESCVYVLLVTCGMLEGDGDCQPRDASGMKEMCKWSHKSLAINKAKKKKKSLEKCNECPVRGERKRISYFLAWICSLCWESCHQSIYVQSSAIVTGFPDESSDADSLLRRIREQLCDSAAASVAFGSAFGRAHICLPFVSFLYLPSPPPAEQRCGYLFISSQQTKNTLPFSKLWLFPFKGPLKGLKIL